MWRYTLHASCPADMLDVTREPGDYFWLGCHTACAASGAAAFLSEMWQLEPAFAAGCVSLQTVVVPQRCCLCFQLQEKQCRLTAGCLCFTSAKLLVKHRLPSVLLMQYLISCLCPKYLRPVGGRVAFGHCRVVPCSDFKAGWRWLVWLTW